jgi:hypothetical protein
MTTGRVALMQIKCRANRVRNGRLMVHLIQIMYGRPLYEYVKYMVHNTSRRKTK